MLSTERERERRTRNAGVWNHPPYRREVVQIQVEIVDEIPCTDRI